MQRTLFNKHNIFFSFITFLGILQNATVFSALALKTETSDKIEIYKTSDGATDILVNSEIVEIVDATSNFNGVKLERSVGDEESVVNFLIVFESEDLSVSVDVSSDLLNVLVMISGERYKGITIYLELPDIVCLMINLTLLNSIANENFQKRSLIFFLYKSRIKEKEQWVTYTSSVYFPMLRLIVLLTRFLFEFRSFKKKPWPQLNLFYLLF